MKFTQLPLAGLVLIEPEIFIDLRGEFIETWNHEDFVKAGLKGIFKQQNHCTSSLGVLRGLHYQLKKPQVKLVRVVNGCIYDVAVDLRRSSPTFGQWHAEELSDENRRMLWIPEGFAHGYVVNCERADIQYSCSEVYDPDDQHAIVWNDPDLAVDWVGWEEDCLTLSRKDKEAGSFAEAEVFA